MQDSIALDHGRLRRQALTWVLALGGLVGCLDPLLDGGLRVRSTVAFICGTILFALIPVLLRTRRFTQVTLFGLFTTWLGFFVTFLASGDYYYLALGISLPAIAAMFLPPILAACCLAFYTFAAAIASVAIAFNAWVPPLTPADLGRSFINESFSVVLISVAVAVPAIWKELRLRLAIKKQLDAQEAAEQERRRFETVVSGAYGALIESDTAGSITFAEGDLIEGLGYTAEGLIGTNPIDLVHDEDKAKLEAVLKTDDSVTGRTLSRVYVDSASQDASDGTAGDLQFELRMKTREDEIRWVRISAAHANDEVSSKAGGQTQPAAAKAESRLVLAIRDIDEEVRSRAQLQEFERLDGLATVCAGLAHDFNNVLTVFGILFERIPDAKLRAELQQAQSQAANLTSGLLTFATRHKTESSTIRIGDITDILEPIVRRIVGATIQTTWTVSCPDANVQMDPSSLQQLFINLVTNARHAMPNGGYLDIQVDAVDVSHDVARTNSISVGTYVQINVKDSGEGMDEGTVSRAFEPFYTTKPRGVGTGLGLSTTHGTVTAGGGAVMLASEFGVGTTVTVLIPKSVGMAETLNPIKLSSDSGAGQSLHGYSASENSSEGEQGEPVVARAATPQLKLALVEDREVLAASLRLMLDRSGFDASVFRTAEELLDSTSLGEFDLVITDVELPGINGFVLVEELRATRPELKFVLMSGHRQPDLSPLHQHPNTTRFIPKPFSFDALLQVISSLTGKPVASGSAK